MILSQREALIWFAGLLSLSLVLLVALPHRDLILLTFPDRRPAEENLFVQNRETSKQEFAAIIALHPPKFHNAAFFLQGYMNCPEAIRQMSIHLVFTNAKDHALFKRMLHELQPHIPEDAWTAIIANVPREVLEDPTPRANQQICAWKKWYGIAHLLDLPSRPMFGSMLDAELNIYNQNDCNAGGPWSKLLQRLLRIEASKEFPAARVGTMKVYNFGSYSMSGKEYDRSIIDQHVQFVKDREPSHLCETKKKACQAVEEMVERVLYTWWTDIPYVNLTVAANMLSSFGDTKVTSYRSLLKKPIRLPRFEYMSYQVWCILHEDFLIKDVTDITKEAPWGSYLEDAREGSRLSDLQPVWVGADSLLRAQTGKIKAMNHDQPPLLVFHVDHQHQSFNGYAKMRRTWEQQMIAEINRCSTSSTYICAIQERAPCKCDGDVWYGQKYTDNADLVSPKMLNNVRHAVKHLKGGGAAMCSNEGIGRDPAPGDEKMCYCVQNSNTKI